MKPSFFMSALTLKDGKIIIFDDLCLRVIFLFPRLKFALTGPCLELRICLLLAPPVGYLGQISKLVTVARLLLGAGPLPWLPMALVTVASTPALVTYGFGFCCRAECVRALSVWVVLLWGRGGPRP